MRVSFHRIAYRGLGRIWGVGWNNRVWAFSPAVLLCFLLCSDLNSGIQIRGYYTGKLVESQMLNWVQ